MTIKRMVNGQEMEFTLTTDEMCEAYEESIRENVKENVYDMLSFDYGGYYVPENAVKEIVNAVVNDIIGGDTMMDNEWGTIRDGIQNYIDNPIVVNKSGAKINYNAALMLMEDDICARLHRDGYDTPQSFFTAYEQAYEEEFGEECELSKANPTW